MQANKKLTAAHVLEALNELKQQNTQTQLEQKIDRLLAVFGGMPPDTTLAQSQQPTTTQVQPVPVLDPLPMLKDNCTG